MTIKVKICGMTTPEAVNAAVAGGADYLGFIFYPPSPRHVSVEKAKEISQDVPASIAKIAVTVDADDRLLEEIVAGLQPAYLQLHGEESPQRVQQVKEQFGLPVVKAIAIAEADDVKKIDDYVAVADIVLLDTKKPGTNISGGTGVPFDWTLLQEKDINCPWMLSGGLSIDNIVEAIEATEAKAVDVSSQLESEKGIKDPELVTALLEKVKAL